MAQALTLKQAREAFVGAEVEKLFPEGLFRGKVVRVKKDVLDSDGKLWPLLFNVHYEDGDKEDLSQEQLEQVLVDRASVMPKVQVVLAQEGGADQHTAAQHKEQRQQRQQRRREDGEEHENYENEAVAATAVQMKRRRVLGEAGQHAMHAERRSKRDVKRRADDDFQYEEAPAAKRGGGGATQQQEAAMRARMGLRQAGQQGAAAAAAASASESQVPYPVADGGMRLTGLPGHLKEIEVFNFMCHEHLKMEFANHVTFVSGTNGSGKSAVLQALQCCLGVKASNTGRANTFKKLVRTGTDEAVVRVTLWNRPYKGHDAFRQDVFGDTIVVERRIAAAGAASYALKDASGRVHGRKREDLEALLQTLGLNAANPVCVMTQDTARNFLAGSSTKADQEKYQLYMEATSLDEIAFSLAESKMKIRMMEEAVEQIKEAYDKMKSEDAELRKSIKALEGIEGWRQEVDQLEQVLAWAFVEQQADGIAFVRSALEQQLPQAIAEAEAQLEEHRREYAALKQAVDSKDHFMRSFSDRSSELLRELDALRARGRETERARRQALAKIERLKEALAEAQAQKQTLEDAVREVEEDVVQQTQAQVVAYQQELDAVRAEEEACRQELADKEAVFRTAQATTKAAHDRAEAARQLRYSTEGRIRSLQQHVAQLREAGRSKLAAFGGQAAVRLAAAIQRCDQFTRKPIGPVGQYLTLKDSRWALAVEAALGLQLNAYLVHTMEDSHLLRRMISQHFQGQPGKPQVYKVNFDLPHHDIPAGAQPPAELPTVYRLLSCSDRKVAAPVMNNLVDAAHIEKIVVADSAEACKRAGYHTANVLACFATDGSKYYRRGATNTQLGPPYWLRGARLGSSAAQQITELEQDLGQLQAALQQQDQDLQEARRQVAEAAEAEKAARLDMAGTKKKEHAAHFALTQLTQQPPPDVLAATQGAGGGESVQADIWQATQVCIDLEQQLRERQEALEQAQAAAREALEAWDEKKAAMRRLEEENEQFTAVYEQELRQCAEAEAKAMQLEQHVQELHARQAEFTRDLAHKVAVYEQCRGDAEQICSREEAAAVRADVEVRLRSKGDVSDDQVAAIFTPDLLSKKIKQLEKKIADHERAAGGSLEELQVQYEASRARMARDGARFKEAIQMYQVVEQAAKLRYSKLQELDHNVEKLVNQRFRHYMWRKGHGGAIKLDRKNRSLSLHVQMNCRASGGAGAGEVRDLKQLSGGERSYTTVAFTLALGGQTEMPFRAMDEFDVFMDAINRRVAMQNLFSFAKDNPELQFIFLSPQDMAAVEDARKACQQAGMEVPEGFVKVVQMRPPRANATRA